MWSSNMGFKHGLQEYISKFFRNWKSKAPSINDSKVEKNDWNKK